jgi:hypothetical protein
MDEHDAEKRLWSHIECVYKDHESDRLKLGHLFLDLRLLYSERANSGGHRRTSGGHGEFERQIKARGFAPRTVRGWITDYEVSAGLRPPGEATAAKRKARRDNTKEYERGYRDGWAAAMAEVERLHGCAAKSVEKFAPGLAVQ